MKLGSLWPAIVINDPVWGLRPVLVARFLTVKVPKPVITTLSPLIKESLILPNTALTVCSALLFVRPTFFATLSTSSFLVMFTMMMSITQDKFPVNFNYLAMSTALTSRMTVTVICPGYVNSSSSFCLISWESLTVAASSTTSGLTITLISLPAWIA